MGGFAINGEFLGEIVLPGRDSSTPVARHFVGRALMAAGHQCVSDAQLVTSELFTNALTHTHSGRPGGLVVVELMASGDGLARIEVIDEGSATLPRPRTPDDGNPHGRGLYLVEQVSKRWGIRLEPYGHKRVWAEVPTKEAVSEGLPDASCLEVTSW
ncbi:ATP-binding protein [Nonomuraea sp. NPDC049607]|uniref:ATP-binding protein n=1 Tax=Nonomuraea sp. NPDC049607 TaxID=3154732 RepID=UPI00342EB0EA